MENIYAPVERLIKQPLRVTIGTETFGVGGSIKTNPHPPLVSYVIPEATQEQYKKVKELWDTKQATRGWIIVKNK